MTESQADILRKREHEELRAKELTDARKKAQSRGVPYFVFRGRVYSLDNSTPSRIASEVEQMFWDALSVLG